MSILVMSGENAINGKINTKNPAISIEGLFLKPVNKENISILFNLGQAYEAEFSSITGKDPDDKGIFNLDTIPEADYTGYLFYQNVTPVGFCVININTSPMDVADFYIIPSKRKQKIGMVCAHDIFNKHQGDWQVRQIQGADPAVKFWRRVIGVYTDNSHKEDIVTDCDWGVITRQTFSSVK